jgi:hypothetical protein
MILAGSKVLEETYGYSNVTRRGDGEAGST